MVERRKERIERVYGCEKKGRGEGRDASGKNVARRWCRCSWTVAEERRAERRRRLLNPSARVVFPPVPASKKRHAVLERIHRMLFRLPFQQDLTSKGNVSKFENYREILFRCYCARIAMRNLPCFENNFYIRALHRFTSFRFSSVLTANFNFFLPISIVKID